LAVSAKTRFIFDGLTYPAKIEKLSAAMTWPPKISLHSAVIFVEAAEYYFGLFSAIFP
jgi:hypothetical protein